MQYELAIDPTLEAVIPPPTAEERTQLEANLLAEGCRDPLAVWAGEPPPQVCPSCPPGTPLARATALIEAREGAVVWLCGFCDRGERRPWTLLDGHSRYAVCQVHDLPFEIREVEAVRTREEALSWMIANQLGRRNLTPEQASWLRGKRYQMEKTAGHGDRAARHNDGQVTAERLAATYHVSPRTIERDGQFVEALEALEQQVRPDIRETVLTRQPRGVKQKATKRQVMKVGRLVQEQRVEPLPFMRRGDWEAYQVLEAFECLGELPTEEHVAVNALVDGEDVSVEQALDLLRQLRQLPAESRQNIYRLHAGADPQHRALALTQAAQHALEPDLPVSYLAQAGEALRRASDWLGKYAERFPDDPWAPDVESLRRTLDAWLGQELHALQAVVRQHHQVPRTEELATPEAEAELGTAADVTGAGEPLSQRPAGGEPGTCDGEAAAADLSDPAADAHDLEPQANAAPNPAQPVCGWCGSNQTWVAPGSGRIYCEHCRAVYNSSTGRWHAGERAKRQDTSASDTDHA
jgi:hypothetical protein